MWMIWDDNQFSTNAKKEIEDRFDLDDAKINIKKYFTTNAYREKKLIMDNHPQLRESLNISFGQD